MALSYLISSYNKRAYLLAVLESVGRELAQTGGEIIIIDDGSLDGSWSAIEDFSRRDPRIKILRQENRGIFNVTNQLIRFGTYEWFRIIDCDDPLIAGSTTLLIRMAERTGADYIFGSTVPYGPEPLSFDKLLHVEDGPRTVERIADPLSYAIRDYNHVPTTALFRRGSVPSGTRLNEDLISCQDLALALHIFETGKVVRIDAPVCQQLVGTPNRLSANEALTYYQTIQILKEFGKTRFDARYKYLSARKLVSRSLRWMRKHKMIADSPLLYSKLVLLYASLQVLHPRDWEKYLENAAKAYAGAIPAEPRLY